MLFFGSRYLGFPSAGRVTIGAQYSSAWDQIWDLVTHLFLPTLTFTLVLLGEYMLVMRSSVVEVFGEDYIQTAKAKGLTTLDIIRKHAFRNAMLPIVTLIALNLGFTVSGAIQVETVFSWPGLGKLTVDAVSQRDYPGPPGGLPASGYRGHRHQPGRRAPLSEARSPGDRRMTTLRRLWAHRLGRIGLVMMAIALAVAVLAPLLAPYDPYANVRVSISDIYAAPSSIHPLGHRRRRARTSSRR